MSPWDSTVSRWQKIEHRGLFSAYLHLSKSKLTLLITSTAACGSDFHFTTFKILFFLTFRFVVGSGSLVSVPFASCVLGTALLSSAANSLNQMFEVPYDAQMKRTQSRVLVVHR